MTTATSSPPSRQEMINDVNETLAEQFQQLRQLVYRIGAAYAALEALPSLDPGPVAAAKAEWARGQTEALRAVVRDGLADVAAYLVTPTEALRSLDAGHAIANDLIAQVRPMLSAMPSVGVVSTWSTSDGQAARAKSMVAEYREYHRDGTVQITFSGPRGTAEITVDGAGGTIRFGAMNVRTRGKPPLHPVVARALLRWLLRETLGLELPRRALLHT